jgi:hypothetical protein
VVRGMPIDMSKGIRIIAPPIPPMARTNDATNEITNIRISIKQVFCQA